MILSFWPTVKIGTSLNLPPVDFSPEQIALIKKAKAIILPPQCKPFQYWFCQKFAPVFPCLATSFQFPGKVGHLFVFQLAQVPYPPTKVFSGIEDFQKKCARGEELYPYPLVVKWNRGGGGAFVYLVRDEIELYQAIKRLSCYEKAGPTFIVQPYIEHDKCDLRVVVIGNEFLTYWRCQQDPKEFRSNVGRGAKIIHHLYPDLEAEAVRLVKKVCQKTGINLAAFDIMFTAKEKAPLFLEINYGFGLTGIGGYACFKEILNREVKKWISQLDVST